MANRLQSEQSYYLLQHAHNPVDWYPWGDEAFNKAKSEDKPVLVSIGYAACHWCHVMERESFENEKVAVYMNEHYVCIKVDREEHPDVDQMYMDAVQSITGSGGWPLNVFVTPDRLPFYGGTYFPPSAAYNRPSWSQLLSHIAGIWEDRRDEVITQAEQMLEHLKKVAKVALSDETNVISFESCRQMADNLLKSADNEHGGFGFAPKFPSTMAIGFLLEHYLFTKYEPALKHATTTLDAMADGGIYDQLAGGFARYSTDRKWLAPHFEKMLYDNAMLISVYADAYQVTQNTRYKTIVEETIAFVELELKDVSGGYYCSLDADSEGVEGKYYTWNWNELKEVIGNEDNVEAQFFGVSEKGNWEGTNILTVSKNAEMLSKQDRVVQKAIEQKVDTVRKQLLEKRNTRIRPLTDDKCLLSWNALMNISLCKAGVALNNQKYLTIAEDHLRWMLETLIIRESIFHSWKANSARITAKLDDLALLIQALLTASSALGKSEYILTADKLTQKVIEEFTDEQGIYFYYTSKFQTDIPVRKIDVYDGVIPSGNSVMAYNLMFLGVFMEKIPWMERADKMMENMVQTAERFCFSYSNWAILLQRNLVGIKTVISRKEEISEMRRNFSSKLYPNVFYLTCDKNISEIPILEKKYFVNKNPIFVCTLKSCFSPVFSVSEAISLVENN